MRVQPKKSYSLLAELFPAKVGDDKTVAYHRTERRAHQADLVILGLPLPPSISVSIPIFPLQRAEQGSLCSIFVLDICVCVKIFCFFLTCGVSFSVIPKQCTFDHPTLFVVIRVPFSFFAGSSESSPVLSIAW
jgi:hypothetical protein